MMLLIMMMLILMMTMMSTSMSYAYVPLMHASMQTPKTEPCQINAAPCPPPACPIFHDTRLTYLHTHIYVGNVSRFRPAFPLVPFGC
ncbi:hypothetical protein K445DRAFT_79773 [Daldinia sp. EC12]|nr:hypothetical protein K445DRAFT_79773 [Daldinia sp. EC12]